MVSTIHLATSMQMDAGWWQNLGKAAFFPVLQKGMDIKRGCDLSEVRANVVYANSSLTTTDTFSINKSLPWAPRDAV